MKIHRQFAYDFESMDEFKDYITPNYVTGSVQELTYENSRDGSSVHKCMILNKFSSSHRSYPTFRYHDALTGLIIFEFWAWVDVDMVTGEWFSLATICNDISDDWNDVISVNIGHDGNFHCGHVPNPGEIKPLIYKGLKFPMKQWNKLSIHVDTHNKTINTYLNGTHGEYSEYEGRNGGIRQTHFGLYCSGAIGEGVCYNDKLRIYEFRD